MDAIGLNDAIKIGLDGILNNRLVVLTGAGLSMAPPSNLPSAAAISGSAKQKYDALYSGITAALSADIEEQADFFFNKSELNVYLNEYVDLHAFAGEPNQGHVAVADFLLSQAISASITTNVDTLVETAAMSLLGQLCVGIDGSSIAAPPNGCKPLLKLHGCWTQDRVNTVWTKSQLANDPVKDRITKSTSWLNTALLDKDLLIVGYSTDWDYLNEVIENAFGAISPASVLVIDPTPTANFAAKATTLSALADKSTKGSFHYCGSGADYLEALRLQYSSAFIRSALAKGASAFELIAGHPPAAASKDAPTADNDRLWRVRRDFLGCGPHDPIQRSLPYDEPALGLAVLTIREAGAVLTGSYWELNGTTVRVIRASGEHLHNIEARYQWEVPPLGSPDITVAVGAEDIYLPPDLVRNPDNSIVRGSGSNWTTWQAFQEAL